MRDKNRFSGLLKHLMTIAKLKNYTLAKELQYDESYISKWVTGSLLPTEKTSEKIFRDISRCVVNSLDADGRATLYAQYQLDNDRDLEEAIFDNLEAEFNYVMDLKESTGSEVAQKTSYYPELTIAQFMQKMRHPVLRQVKSLDVISASDILSLDRHYQLALAELENSNNVNVTQRSWPGVHFSMLINLNAANTDNTYNVQFILNLLTNLSNVDFQLYACPQSQGKIVFAVKDAYCISGMIMDETHCISVTTTEEAKNCNAIYDRLQSLCSQDMLVVRRTTMAEMLRTNQYMQYTFSRNQRWLMSHMTEHFLPDDLFEELVEEYCQLHKDTDRATLTRMHKLSSSVLESMPVRMIICESGVNDFTVTGRVDFYNQKMTLTPEQRLRCLQYISELPEKNPALSFGILKNGRFSDLQHIPNPTMFLSDGFCYLRLNKSGPAYNLSILNRVQVCDQFRDFFEAIWRNQEIVDTYYNASVELMRYAIQMIQVQILVEK